MAPARSTCTGVGVAAWLDAIGDRPCLGDETGWITGTQAARLVCERRRAFGPGRRLVRLVPAPRLDRVIDQLAVLDAGHVLLLSDADQTERLDAAWRPDTVVDDRGVRVVHPEPEHELHPDLALALSTSGSTGSPKLVRLSAANLVANARSIAASLGLTPDDRAITSLPLHYCYGLSVLHSHLVAGGSVRLASASVVDPCFWNAVDADGVTNLAGVPHTFELLERSGLERLGRSSVRLVTQAGGRMAPERVRHLADRGGVDGWDLVVMYGQTEATARMACLPAPLASVHPDAVGRPIPGGSFDIRCPETGRSLGVGEEGRVVYRGPNVMMGYAVELADLARPAELDELVTGDLGRIDDAGLLHIVGRESRFAKLFGLRIDLQRVEERLADEGLSALAASDDRRLVVAVERPGGAVTVAGSSIRATIAESTGLPPTSVDVVAVDDLPRLASGKPDARAVLALAVEAAPAESSPGHESDGAPDRRQGRSTDQQRDARLASIADTYRLLLGVPDVGPDDTFVSLGGDSLAYVEASIRLERRLGALPDDWHVTPVHRLADRAADAPDARRPVFWARTDTTVVLRALAIMLVVSSHMRLFYVPVGSHVLLAVAGYNFARFHLADTTSPRWVSSVAGTFGRIALVSSAWIGLQMLLFGGHSVATLLLVNSYVGDLGVVGTTWRYWYIEVLVHIGVVLIALLAWPRVRAIERRFPFWFPVALLAPLLVLRFEWVMLGSDPRNAIFQADTVAWLFALGWIIRRATARWQQVVATGLVLASVPNYFWHDDRNLRLLVGVLVLVWVPWVPVPRPLQRLIGWIAAASLSIYLTHYVVFPELDDHLADHWVFPLTIAAGVGVWMLTARLGTALARRRRAWRRDRRGGRPVAEDRASAEAAGEQLDRVDHGTVGEPARL